MQKCSPLCQWCCYLLLCSYTVSSSLSVWLLILNWTFQDLKSILNADKTKNKSYWTFHISLYFSAVLQSVSSYKSLGFLIDSCLSFKPHIQLLVKLRLVFHFRGKSHFSFSSKKETCCWLTIVLLYNVHACISCLP